MRADKLCYPTRQLDNLPCSGPPMATEHAHKHTKSRQTNERQEGNDRPRMAPPVDCQRHRACKWQLSHHFQELRHRPTAAMPRECNDPSAGRAPPTYLCREGAQRHSGMCAERWQRTPEPMRCSKPLGPARPRWHLMKRRRCLLHRMCINAEGRLARSMLHAAYCYGGNGPPHVEPFVKVLLYRSASQGPVNSTSKGAVRRDLGGFTSRVVPEAGADGARRNDREPDRHDVPSTPPGWVHTGRPPLLQTADKVPPGGRGLQGRSPGVRAACAAQGLRCYPRDHSRYTKLGQ